MGNDGRTPYERITSHKSKHFIIGFGEVVDFILETDKGNRHKADSRVGQGIFLGYAWRSTEYIIGTKDGIFQCRTVKRRADEVAYDPECVNYILTQYDEFVLKGARTTVAVSHPSAPGEKSKCHFEDESLCRAGHTSGQQTSPSSVSVKGAQDASGLKMA